MACLTRSLPVCHRPNVSVVRESARSPWTPETSGTEQTPLAVAASADEGEGPVAELWRDPGYRSDGREGGGHDQEAPGPRCSVPLPQRAGQAAHRPGQPAISVDTNKKELAGDDKTKGWAGSGRQPASQSEAMRKLPCTAQGQQRTRTEATT
ncbi:hypothetical protein GCM10010219_52870 [Streptomyces netropsis]|nr:hypothetical protein GCM10010219_52870 [Streptomyces netropsis]